MAARGLPVAEAAGSSPAGHGFVFLACLGCIHDVFGCLFQTRAPPSAVLRKKGKKKKKSVRVDLTRTLDVTGRVLHCIDCSRCPVRGPGLTPGLKGGIGLAAWLLLLHWVKIYFRGSGSGAG